MNTQVQIKKQRQYFIDWLRIGLIISVFFFHIGMIFRLEQWHINSAETLPFLDPIMSWLHIWRMPLLFLVSGVGTYYALGYRTAKQYLKERSVRLMIPFVIGLFLLVPIQVYIEKIDQFNSLPDFYTHMFEGIYPAGNFSWHHLWFILYLFLISLIISPFISYSRSEHFKKAKTWLVSKMSKTLGLNWILPIILLSQLILRAYFPDNTHALYNDWAYIALNLIFFLSGFILFTSEILINAITKQRRLYLIQTILFTVLYFFIQYNFEFTTIVYYLKGTCRFIIALSCGITALGYTKTYLNKDNKYRKHLNEAIYPFYLLHQPIIILVGYIILQWNLSISVNIILITFISLILIIGLYWFVIRKFNITRIIFGLKWKSKRKEIEAVKLKAPIFNK